VLLPPLTEDDEKLVSNAMKLVTFFGANRAGGAAGAGLDVQTLVSCLSLLPSCLSLLPSSPSPLLLLLLLLFSSSSPPLSSSLLLLLSPSPLLLSSSSGLRTARRLASACPG